MTENPLHEGDVGVAVIGGGPAGIAAALAAAACTTGPVLLVERDSRVGGNVSQALVHTICGLYLASASKKVEYAHAGLPRFFAEAMIGDALAGDIDWAGNAGFLAIDPEGFAATAERLCNRDSIRSWTSSRLVELDAPLGPRDCWRLVVERPGGKRENVTAWTVIDTSGDANAAVLAGVATDIAPADQLQHASYIFRIDGVDLRALDRMERARVSMFVAREARRGSLSTSCGSVLLRPAARGASVFATMNLVKPERFDPLDDNAAAELQRRAAADAETLLALLVRERAPFRDARAGAWPARVGVRETRRIRGLECLGIGDVLAGRRRDDEVCVSTWPVEDWSSAVHLDFRPCAGPSSIPLGCLIADHPAQRFAMAGRCASASHEALGAIRVIATSMAMGEAAGAACGLAAGRGSDLGAIGAEDVREAIASGVTIPH